jgi:four helix bundle protein
MRTRSYRDLVGWQRAMQLSRASYAVARRLPDWETFGLASQIRRASASVPAQIAEGHGSAYRGEFPRFLSIAQGSLTEPETHLLLCVEVDYLRREAVAEPLGLADETGRMVRALRRTLASR